MAEPTITYFTMPPSVRVPLIVNCVAMFLVVIVVTLRIMTRIRGMGIGWDDGFILLATTMGISCLAVQGAYCTMGMGYDMVPSAPEYEQVLGNSGLVLQIFFGFQLLYVNALAVIKASVLCFYARIFNNVGLRSYINAMLGIVLVWALSFSLAMVFACKPVSYQWNLSIPGGGVCGDLMALYATLIVTNIITDLIIMGLPLYTIWNLKMRGLEKAGLAACFALGSVVVVTTCVRLATVFNNDVRGNFTGTMPTTIFLCVFEILLGILCVSIPILRPLYQRYKWHFSSLQRSREPMDSGAATLRRNRFDRAVRGVTTLRSKSRGRTHFGNSSFAVAKPEHTWDLEDFAYPGKENKFDAFGQDRRSDSGTSSSSSHDSVLEKRFMADMEAQQQPQIAVETSWTVTRTDFPLPKIPGKYL